MNCEILSYLGYIILVLLGYLIIAPIPKLLYYKIKFGNKVSIYYCPIIGLLGQVIYDIIAKNDAFYSQKRYVTSNKNLKLHVSNDLKGGVHFSLVDPKLKKIVYSDQDSYKKMEGLPFADTFLDQGLLFQGGEGWAKSRRMLTKHFTYEDLLTMVETLKEECQNLSLKDGPIDILNLIKQLTSTTITKTFFGSENNRVADLGLDVNQNMEAMMKFFLNPLVLLRCFALKMNKTTTPSWLLSSGEKAFLKQLQAQKQRVIAEIDQGIQQINEKKVIKDNILTTMCKEIIKANITKEEAIHQYFTLLIAGIDSTSHVVKNFTYALALYPEVQQRLRDEIKNKINSFEELTPQQLGQLTLMNNFINEAFRHFTAVPSLFNRVAVKDVHLGEFLVQKGQSMDLNMMMTHFDPNIFEDPLKFDIDRWNKPPVDTFAFTPFSAGGRNCIGQHLALLEIKTLLVFLIIKFELKLNSGKIMLGLANMYGPTRRDFLVLNNINLQNKL